MTVGLKNLVEQNCTSQSGDPSTLKHWSEVIFARCIFLLAPLSLVAIIPAVIICLKTDNYFILGFDILSFFVLISIGYLPGLSVSFRKSLLIGLVYLTAFVLLRKLGVFGPGLVYLLAVTVFHLLIFPYKNPKIPFLLTIIFCLIYGLLIQVGVISTVDVPELPLLAWFAISSNVVFLAILFTMMMPFFFKKLEETIQEKQQLLQSLGKVNVELNRSIAEVKQKNSELEEFAYIASHDLKTPVRNIIGLLQVIERKGDQMEQDKKKHFLNTILNSSHELSKMIDDLLEYSRSGINQEQVETIKLDDFCEEIVGQFQQDIEQLGGKITHDFEIESLRAYPLLFKRLFTNILSNALKYRSSSPPEIAISCSKSDEKITFKIKDNGIGIPLEHQEEIFKIFKTLKNSSDSNGIGLSVCKKIVELHDGKIWVESDGKNGSTFIIEISANLPG